MDIRDGVVIQGAGPTTTIIQAGTTNSNGIDRVIQIELDSFSTSRDVVIDNVTIRYGRTAATGHGGGINFDVYNTGVSGTLTLRNAIVTENWAGRKGGGLYIQPDTLATTRIFNTIVGGNFKAGGAASDVTGPLHSSSGYNLIGTGGSGGLANGVNGNQIGATAAQLGLGPLQDNGTAGLAAYVGPRLTHGLLGGSLALDAGSNTYVDAVTYGGPYTTDARGIGFHRKLDAGDSEDTTDEVDIGALEMHPAIGNMTDVAVIQDPPSVTVSFPFHLGDGDLGI
ncbi:MAG TPA: choice-of-anchor Q domain-containing protein, partial [Symbiobacteriaceae bacterium]|nr:choice-of-anchor Q domain-containing protein [Symbiobacteriaceae bacterium]